MYLRVVFESFFDPFHHFDSPRFIQTGVQQKNGCKVSLRDLPILRLIAVELALKRIQFH